MLVTGASRGIGEAIAREMAARGASVALVARSVGPLEALAAELGGTAHPADLGDPAAVGGLLHRVEAEAGGPVDVVVNNAGIDEVGPLSGKQPDDLRRIVALNLVAAMELSRQAVHTFVPRGRGHVVNVSSYAAVAAFPGMAPYAATKAGLSHFSRLLATELRGTGVAVTLVELGPVPSDLLDHANAYEPVRAGFQRGYTLRFLVDVPRDRVASKVADAVERERRRVRLPVRSAGFALLADFPQALLNVLTTGVPRR